MFKFSENQSYLEISSEFVNSWDMEMTASNSQKSFRITIICVIFLFIIHIILKLLLLLNLNISALKYS